MERTFVILKPDTFKNGTAAKVMEDIITALPDLKIVGMRHYKSLPIEKLREHYSHIADKSFYPSVEAYMTSADALAIVYKGVNVVSRIRKLAGATNPADAESYTLRAKYGSVDEDGTIYNVIHCSDSPENAEREIKLWEMDKAIIIDKGTK